MDELSGKHVLVIDDNEPIRNYLKYVLEKEGYTVEVAADGNEGLACFSHSGFDIVITDISMPGRDGIDTIIAIRELNPAVRIVAISGVERSERLLKIADFFSADATLIKPFTPDHLLAIIRNFKG